MMQRAHAEKPKVAGIIPARYGSTRLPGKAMRLIAGKPMIQRVLERCPTSPAWYFPLWNGIAATPENPAARSFSITAGSSHLQTARLRLPAFCSLTPSKSYAANDTLSETSKTLKIFRLTASSTSRMITLSHDAEAMLLEMLRVKRPMQFKA